MRAQRQVSMHEGPANNLVERIVTAYIFSETEQPAQLVEQSCRMTATRLEEEMLLRCHAFGQAKQERSVHMRGRLRLDALTVLIIDPQGLNGGLPTDPAAGGGVKVPLHCAGVHARARV